MAWVRQESKAYLKVLAIHTLLQPRGPSLEPRRVVTELLCRRGEREPQRVSEVSYSGCTGIRRQVKDRKSEFAG